MMRRITKAFIIGTIDAVTAVIIFLSALTRPNRRMTRKARMSFTSQSGMFEIPISISDIRTMPASSQFHPLLMNCSNQFENALKTNSIVKATVNSKFSRWSRTPKYVKEPF